MSNKRIVLFVVMIFSLPIFLWAQEKHAIKLLAKSTGKTILLRWAPSDARSWKEANQQGYILERYTIARGQQLVSPPEKVLLSKPIIKPAPLPQWEKDADKNDFSAVAAQAIYGSSFEAKSPAGKSGVAEVINKVKEQEQRFSFALFAADQSFKTAQLSGLAFKDSTAKKEERYLYRLFVSSLNSTLKMDTGIFYIGLRDTTSAAPISGLHAEFENRLVKLHWPKAVVEQLYSGYVIERSIEKQNNFQRVNKIPFVGFPGASEEYTATDSLPSNDVLCYYRIRGITPFGETGPPSEIISGTGFKPMKAAASITEAKESANSSVLIKWKLSGDERLVKGFDVERSFTEGGEYVTTNTNLLPATQRLFSDLSPGSTNYYRIKTRGAHGEVTVSLPYLVQLADSIPPSPPSGLEVTIDTLGIVSLRWKSNTEKDLLGYRIFRSNFKGAEYSQISSQPVLNAFYTDTISLKSLTSKIYYKISAEDKRHNPSSFSEVILLEKPDRIPPVAPVIKSIRAIAGGIVVEGIKSSSEDVVSYILQRRNKTVTAWISIKNFNATDSLIYRDVSAAMNTDYYYSFVAIDQSGNKSIASKPAIGKALRDTKRKAIDNISIEADRTQKVVRLKWKYSEVGVSKYLIYRAVSNETLTLYKALPASNVEFDDNGVKMDSSYEYRVKVIFNDGAESLFSEVLEIKY